MRRSSKHKSRQSRSVPLVVEELEAREMPAADFFIGARGVQDNLLVVHGQPMNAIITNMGSETSKFSFNIKSFGSGSIFGLPNNEVTLAPGGSYTYAITGASVSEYQYDVEIEVMEHGSPVAGEPVTIVRVQANDTIYDENTPKEMLKQSAYRISRNKPIDLTVQVSPALNTAQPTQFVTIKVDGQGSMGFFGAATIDGTSERIISQTTTMELNGTAQTRPGHGRNLRIVAQVNGNKAWESNPFSVAVIRYR